MENILVLSQIIISVSILIVWVFRYDNIVIEFEQYGLSSLLRNIVGASKISLSTILVFEIYVIPPEIRASCTNDHRGGRIALRAFSENELEKSQDNN